MEKKATADDFPAHPVQQCHVLESLLGSSDSEDWPDCEENEPEVAEIVREAKKTTRKTSVSQEADHGVHVSSAQETDLTLLGIQPVSQEADHGAHRSSAQETDVTWSTRKAYTQLFMKLSKVSDQLQSNRILDIGKFEHYFGECDEQLGHKLYVNLFSNVEYCRIF